MSSSNSRRDFSKKFLVFVGASTLVPSFLASLAKGAEERRRPRPTEGAAAGGAAAGASADLNLPLAEPGKGVAGSLNYVHDRKDVKDAKLKQERAGVPFDKQNCANCALYTNVGKKGSDEVGKCAVIQGNLVKSQGWCSSWAKKG